MTLGERAFARLPRERRMGEIMAAARSVFRERGYDAASVADIAARAGVVEGSVYRYFEHKHALLVKVLEHWYEELFADYDAHLAQVDGTWSRLRFMVWKHLSIIQQEPALCRLVLSELRPDPAYRGTSVFELNRRYTSRTIDLLREGIAAGEVRPDADLVLARDMIYGSVEHQTWAFLRGEGTFSADAAADGITGIIRRGLALGPTGSEAAGRVDPALASVVARLERIAARLDPHPAKKRVPRPRRR